MNKRFIALVILICCMMILTVALSAQSGNDGGRRLSFMTIISYIAGYCLLGGAFIGLPLIVYTNQAEKIFFATDSNKDQVNVLDNLTEQERNDRADAILTKIYEKLHHLQDEDGNGLMTINSGKQAKLTKRGLDYINKRLAPTSQDVIERVNALAAVYDERTKRSFTGSKWVIISGALFCLLSVLIKAWGMAFVWTLGLVFYVMASRMTIYGMEKMIEWKGTVNIGCVAALFSVLWSGMNTTYYNVYKDGRKEMDLHSTLGSGLVYFGLMMFIVMMMVLFMPIIGALNFVLNYWSSLLIPFGYDEDKWYQENIA